MCGSQPIKFNVTESVTTNAGKQKYSLKAWTKIKDHAHKVIGLFVRKQNGASTRYSMNGNKLLNNNSLAACYLQIKQNSSDAIFDYPLENFVHESGVNGPGEYASVKFENGIDVSGSFIVINNGAAIVNNEDIEIVFIVQDLCN